MPTNEVKEISIRRSILTLQHYVSAGLKGWLWMLVGAVLVTTYMVWSALVMPAYYEAKVVFVVNENQGGGGSGIGSVLGQIALGGNGGGANLQRIKAFVTSRKLLNDLMLETVTINDKPDLVANHLIEVGELVEAFEMNPAFGPTSISGDSLLALSRAERSLMKTLYYYLVFSKERPLVANIEEVTDMLIVTIRTRNEDLSLYLAESLFRNLTNFYTEEATGPARISVERLQHKADSVLQALNAAEYQLASFVDTKLSLTNRRDQLRSFQLNRKISVLSTAYGEIVRNLETAKFSLDATTPFFKLIDSPFKPLSKRQKDPYEAAATGAVIGALLAFLLVIAVTYYKDIMQQREIDA